MLLRELRDELRELRLFRLLRVLRLVLRDDDGRRDDEVRPLLLMPLVTRGFAVPSYIFAGSSSGQVS